jgi:hypothetical protein
MRNWNKFTKQRESDQIWSANADLSDGEFDGLPDFCAFSFFAGDAKGQTPGG